MDNSKHRQNDLGVNKMGKNIRKSPLHQPNYANNAPRQQPQPQVYNISKNDFRNIVQQLTGSPSRDPLPRPPQNPPKPQSMRLQRIRPSPLTQINRPHIPSPVPANAPPPMAPPPVPYSNNMARPPQFVHPSPPTTMQPFPHTDGAWANTAESPISAYMRYLQASMEPSPIGYRPHFQPQPQPQPQPHPHSRVPVQAQAHVHVHPPSAGLPPNPSMHGYPSPRMNGPPGLPPMPNLPSPRMNSPALLPSPTSQFLLPSPTGYKNLLSPTLGSPYPLLSPGVRYPPPLTPNFTFPQMSPSGYMGPGTQPPLSPNYLYPLSPSGFFPVLSPRWRDQ